MFTLRKCVKCKNEKPATAEFFYRDKNRYLGLMYRCKECDKQKIDNRTWKERRAGMSQQQIEDAKARQRVYNKSVNGRISSTLKAYQKYDQDRGYENDLTKEEIRSAKLSQCYYCSFPATGFDRINNKKGHTKENVVPCCKECNVARMDNFSHEEMLILGAAIRTIKEKRFPAL